MISYACYLIVLIFSDFFSVCFCWPASARVLVGAAASLRITERVAHLAERGQPLSCARPGGSASSRFSDPHFTHWRKQIFFAFLSARAGRPSRRPARRVEARARLLFRNFKFSCVRSASDSFAADSAACRQVRGSGFFIGSSVMKRERHLDFAERSCRP